MRFAEALANGQQAVFNQAVVLSKKLGVTSRNNAIAKLFLALTAKTKAMHLKNANAFSKAYIGNEASYHKVGIKEVEAVLTWDASKELRMGHAAGATLAPVSTDAAIATTRTLPEFKGGFSDVAV